MDEKLHFDLRLYKAICCLVGLLCLGRLVAGLPSVTLVGDVVILGAIIVPYQMLAVRMQAAMEVVTSEEGYQMRYLETRHDALDDWFCLGLASAMVPMLAALFLRLV